MFIDEIDAVGRHRGAGLGGGHDEREQTLNQLLVEMDGFDQRSTVILMAATNRPDILDPALLRPGRFDRQVVIDRPDLEGRKAILKVHARGKPLDASVELDILARRTPGFTGADLANVINEAALLAARRNKRAIRMSEIEEAVDRVMAGPERKSRVMDEKERRLIAYHEGGHAMVAHVLPNTDEVHKITVIPRGRALGYTLTLPEQDKFMMTREQLRDELAMLMGGRVAEEVVAGDVTTGAQNDIERATKVARQMVTEYGMSDTIGPRTLGQKQGEVFLGRDWGSTPDYSDAVAFEIDQEVRQLIDEAHDVALDILTENRDKLDALATLLLDKETLNREEVEKFFGDIEKRSPREPQERGAGLAVSRKALRQQPDPPGTLGRPGLAPAVTEVRQSLRTLRAAAAALVVAAVLATVPAGAAPATRDVGRPAQRVGAGGDRRGPPWRHDPAGSRCLRAVRHHRQGWDLVAGCRIVVGRHRLQASRQAPEGPLQEALGRFRRVRARDVRR